MLYTKLGLRQGHGWWAAFALGASVSHGGVRHIITSSSRSSSTCPGPTMLRSSTTFVGGPEITAPCITIALMGSRQERSNTYHLCQHAPLVVGLVDADVATAVRLAGA